ncbi:MAG: lipid A export permease/ATP-binding protein MsbA [Gammaproteobacteria bacterium]|jgi:subfamily B ATP-binding cassette protein MsbA|nr:lipid A export permease/ATP-binding protein MsbA [Xanthomonadales bacterium]
MTAELKNTSFSRIWQYTKPYKLALSIAILGALLDAMVQGSFMLLFKYMIDDAFGKHDQTIIRLIPWVIVVMFLIRGSANYLSTYGLNWVGRKVIADLRQLVFSKYLRLPSSFFDKQPSATLISRMTFDIEMMAMGVALTVINVIRDVLTILVLIGVMLSQSVQLTVIVFILVPIVGGIIAVLNKRFRKISHRIQNSMSGVSEVVGEVVKGQKIVRIFSGQQDEEKRFYEVNNRNRYLNMKIVSIRALSSSSVQILTAIALALIVYFATVPEAINNWTGGTFMAFISSMMAMLPPLKRMSDSSAMIQKTLAAADSVFYVLDYEAEEDTGIIELDAKEINIEFKDVSFSYDGENQALDNVSLKITNGESVAFVGESGGGKSTLVNLVPRFYSHTTGKLLLNNQDVNDYTLESLRKHISFVDQNVVLFNDTVANNIAYGANKSANLEQVKQAAVQANALDFIEELPNGFDTVIGEDGTRLSGGQRQRIAIARAILKDAPLLILDEATSALDSESEKIIQAALQNVMKGRTTLVIAHRLSTIENADKVVVMSKGGVAEIGTHKNLLQHDGIYAKLHRLQGSVH